jgi:hypothetical protein
MGFIPEWALGVGVIIIAVTIGRTLSAMIRLMGARAASRRLPASDEEIGELRQSLDSMQTRLSEVEERLDFTERLLAKQSPPR